MKHTPQIQHADELAEWWLGCSQCGSRFAIGPFLAGCPVCTRDGNRSVLEVGFCPDKPPTHLSNRKGVKGIRRYLDLLPCGNVGGWVSLGEGGSPLLRSRVIGPELGMENLYFKNDTVNPTWSFKDRYVAVTINVARNLGFRRFVVSSTGNLGVAVAAYSAAAGTDCVFLAPRGTARPLLDQASLHGARVIVAEDDCRRDLFERIARHKDWFPVGLFLPREVQNPFGIEGYKTLAYELIEDLGASPKAVLFPCARGNGLYGAWKGFREAAEWGWAKRIPAMVACQPKGANSLEISLQRGLEYAVELPKVTSVAVSTTETVASDHALNAIRASGGDALSASDAEILESVRKLGREGLCVEASSALPVACLPRLLDRKLFDPSDTVVCILTAAGIKWPDGIGIGGRPVVEIKDGPETIDEICREIGVDHGS